MELNITTYAHDIVIANFKRVMIPRKRHEFIIECPALNKLRLRDNIEDKTFKTL